MFVPFSGLPWLVPGLLVSFVVAAVFGGTVARRAGTGPWVGRALIVAIGLILAATLTPDASGLAGEHGPATCDFRRWTLIPLRTFLAFDDASLNVFLFMPLGLVLAALPRRIRGWAILVAAVTPVVIETIQLVLPAIGRGCESADVVDNLTGLLVGLGVGILIRWSAGWAESEGAGPNSVTGSAPATPVTRGRSRWVLREAPPLRQPEASCRPAGSRGRGPRSRRHPVVGGPG